MQRMKTAKEGWFGFFKIAYAVCSPFLLFIGCATLYALSSSRQEANIPGLPLFALLVWAAVLVPTAWFVFGIYSRRQLLKSIVAELRSSEFFNPAPGFEAYHEGDGKYLGIDVDKGTILYVHKIRKGEVDVVALTMDDWTDRAVDGNLFRLFTKFPQLPRIEIATPWADRWFDTLGAMEYQKFAGRAPFAQYVSRKLEQLERNHRIQIPRVA